LLQQKENKDENAEEKEKKVGTEEQLYLFVQYLFVK
jgi:hypothetical protein